MVTKPYIPGSLQEVKMKPKNYILFIIILFFPGFYLDSSVDKSEPKITVERKGQRYFINGIISPNSSRFSIWDVLRDYNNFSKFLPNVIESKAKTENNNKIVTQKLNAGFMFLKKETHLTLKVQEEPFKLITFKNINSKHFKEYFGKWDIIKKNNQQYIHYTLIAEPNFFTPSFISKNIFTKEIGIFLSHLKNEIEKRDRLIANHYFVADQGSLIVLKGNSTVYKYQCEAKNFKLHLIIKGTNEDDMINILNGGLDYINLSLPTKNLMSTKEKLNKKMYPLIEQNNSKTINFSMISYTVNNIIKEPIFTLNGNLSIAGHTNKVSIPIKITKKNNILYLSGSKILKMSDYKIKPPKMFVLKTHDEVEIHTNFKLKLKK